MPSGLILFAHGSRDPAWAESLRALSREVASAAPSLRLAEAYLELQGPDLPTAVAALAQDCERIDVCPVFWAATGHVQRDVPALLDQARQRHPGVSIRLLPALSEVPGLLPFLALSLAQLTTEPAPPPRA